MFTVNIPKAFLKYIVPTGSIALDGVSLTIAEINGSCIKVSIIPHTMEYTIFKFYKIGDNVNLEFDIIGKYIEKLMVRQGKETEEKQFLTEKHLRELGY